MKTELTAADPKKKWVKEVALDRKHGNSIPPSYPHEGMVKIFSTGYYSKLFSALVPGQRVLDVGCGYGNNLTYFLDRGLKANGVEVTPDMVELATENLKRLGHGEIGIVLGENEKIPFPDETFDVVISTAAIHYQQGAEAMMRALGEFKRVTKKGGKVFITTAGANHEIRAKTKKNGPLNWIVLDYDFRSNDIFSFFDDQSHLEQIAKEFFSQVETGTLLEKYATRALEFYYALCVK